MKSVYSPNHLEHENVLNSFRNYRNPKSFQMVDTSTNLSRLKSFHIFLFSLKWMLGHPSFLYRSLPTVTEGKDPPVIYDSTGQPLDGLPECVHCGSDRDSRHHEYYRQRIISMRGAVPTVW